MTLMSLVKVNRIESFLLFGVLLLVINPGCIEGPNLVSEPQLDCF